MAALGWDDLKVSLSGMSTGAPGCGLSVRLGLPYSMVASVPWVPRAPSQAVQ